MQACLTPKKLRVHPSPFSINFLSITVGFLTSVRMGKAMGLDKSIRFQREHFSMWTTKFQSLSAEISGSVTTLHEGSIQAE